VQSLGEANKRVLVQAYSFTSDPITDALIKASQRGVAVQVIMDKSQRTAQGTSANELMASGVPVRIDAAHAIAHNKVMVIDGQTVITGSFNFTQSAEERNAENLLVIRNRALADRYERNWQAHQAHAVPYKAGAPSERRP
jgi:phosphatidylserine/phosphatidylglycerophosphate/cardiolipin synthase-like enzyme